MNVNARLAARFCRVALTVDVLSAKHKGAAIGYCYIEVSDKSYSGNSPPPPRVRRWSRKRTRRTNVGCGVQLKRFREARRNTNIIAYLLRQLCTARERSGNNIKGLDQRSRSIVGPGPRDRAYLSISGMYSTRTALEYVLGYYKADRTEVETFSYARARQRRFFPSRRRSLPRSLWAFTANRGPSLIAGLPCWHSDWFFRRRRRRRRIII